MFSYEKFNGDKVSLGKKDVILNETITHAHLSFRTIENTKFVNVVFENCNLISAVFRNCEFHNCIFIGCNFEEMYFAECKLFGGEITTLLNLSNFKKTIMRDVSINMDME